MPLPVITDHFFVQATFQRADGDAVVNTFCFRNENTGIDVDAVADNLRSLLDSFYGNRGVGLNTVGEYMSPTLYGLNYVIYDLGSPDAGGLERSSVTWPDTPGTVANLMPPDCAVTISWQTARRGRSYRGRTYLGPLVTGLLDDSGTVNAAARDEIASAAYRLIGNQVTRDATICVMSRTLGVATPVLGGYVDSEFDTQRRRGYQGTTRSLIEPSA